MPDLFSVPVFFIIFRETLETSIIVSVLLAFLKQTLPNASDAALAQRMRRQIWLGTFSGSAICLFISACIVAVFYLTETDAWSSTEYYYEGAFALFASFIITVTGAALLRINKMQEKWHVKLRQAIEDGDRRKRRMKRDARNGGGGSGDTGNGNDAQGWLGRWMSRYFMFVLPFVTVLREGVEAVVFIAGVTFSAPAESVPLPVLTGLATGSFVGWLIYRTGSTSHLQLFLVAATCILYLVAAALFTRAVWFFEQQQWNIAVGGDAAEVGVGPGSYDIDKSVWHVNCCSPYINGGGGWGVFNGLLGWQNSATYGSVISYNVYWWVVIGGFLAMRHREVKGHWPLMRKRKTV
ncbi:putative iron transferase [Microdochium trichocladiopsis]|uniref:Iron transferase n=1 Tax=Microdochium trichocladiopsis TaxID=1682393 RepID=A0A9P8XXK0_9PEZI|nr:putative iron transferase [Microdochium trichocladiopsis]KAH7024676.1 putative iron transferase [Microdochium trichocladiopsis]